MRLVFGEHDRALGQVPELLAQGGQDLVSVVTLSRALHSAQRPE
jgi:hypothetical protein